MKLQPFGHIEARLELEGWPHTPPASHFFLETGVTKSLLILYFYKFKLVFCRKTHKRYF